MEQFNNKVQSELCSAFKSKSKIQCST